MATKDGDDLLPDPTPVAVSTEHEPEPLDFDEPDEPVADPEPEPAPDPAPKAEQPEEKHPPVPKEVMLLNQKLATQRKQTEEALGEIRSQLKEVIELAKAGQARGATAQQKADAEQAADDLQDDLAALEAEEYFKPLVPVFRKLGAKLGKTQSASELKAIQDKIEELTKSQREEAQHRQRELSQLTYAKHWESFKRPVEDGGFGFDGQPLYEETRAAVEAEYEGESAKVIDAVVKERFNRLVAEKVEKSKTKPDKQPAAPTRTTKPSAGTETVSPSASGQRQAQAPSGRRRTPDHAIWG